MTRRVRNGFAALPAALAVVGLVGLIGGAMSVRSRGSHRMLAAIAARRAIDVAVSSALEEAAGRIERAANAGGPIGRFAIGTARHGTAAPLPAQLTLTGVAAAFAADGIAVGAVDLTFSDLHREVVPATADHPGQVREYGVVQLAFTVEGPRAGGRVRCRVKSRRFFAYEPRTADDPDVVFRVSAQDLVLEVEEA